MSSHTAYFDKIEKDISYNTYWVPFYSISSFKIGYQYNDKLIRRLPIERAKKWYSFAYKVLVKSCS